MNWFAWRRGLRRLKRGYCPLCNSSPPKPDCPICHGDYTYGPILSDKARELWHFKWQQRRWGR